MSAMQPPLSKINNYPEFLNSYWLKHLLPREKDAPTVISTFAGGGGSSLGYSMAGFRELLAVEKDNHAVQTFSRNFPEVPVYHGDIQKLTVDELSRLTDLKPGELDLFDGSPPCQGFSSAGRRKFNDERNFLFREYLRLLGYLQPKALIMENVSGMVRGKMKLIFADILKELKAVGYNVRVQLLNAVYFGVPQNRNRLIFFGIRNDLNLLPQFPSAKYRPVTIREAVGNIETVGMPLTGKVGKIGLYVRPGEDFSIGNNRMGNKGTAHFSSMKLKWDQICPTITKTQHGNLGGLVHPEHNNLLSLAAFKRLGSFPDEFILEGEETDCIARIGNSVPPLLMHAVAEKIREVLNF